MAKRYRITEEQYKTVLNHLNIQESEMVSEYIPVDGMGPEDTPNYTLTNVEINPGQTEPALVFYWTEEGSGRIFQGKIYESDLIERGADMQQIVTQFQATAEVPQEIEYAAWDNAEPVDSGSDDSDYTGEI